MVVMIVICFVLAAVCLVVTGIGAGFDFHALLGDIIVIAVGGIGCLFLGIFTLLSYAEDKADAWKTEMAPYIERGIKTTSDGITSKDITAVSDYNTWAEANNKPTLSISGNYTVGK
jgi:hypothetical protein